jgi:hypothetical protein
MVVVGPLWIAAIVPLWALASNYFVRFQAVLKCTPVHFKTSVSDNFGLSFNDTDRRSDDVASICSSCTHDPPSKPSPTVLFAKTVIAIVESKCRVSMVSLITQNPRLRDSPICHRDRGIQPCVGERKVLHFYVGGGSVVFCIFDGELFQFVIEI